MVKCEGIHDWTRCPKCEYLCTSLCPIENPALMDMMSARLKAKDKALPHEAGGQENNKRLTKPE